MAIFGKTTTATVTNSSSHIYTKTGTAVNVTVVNVGSVSVVIGGATGITAATGLVVAAGSQLVLEGPDTDLWAITASGTTTVLVGLSTLVAVD